MKKSSFSLLAMIFITVAIGVMTGCQESLTPTDHVPVREATAVTADNYAASLSTTGVHEYQKIFDGGDGDYHSFRIPSIVRTPDGTLIAFAEGRKDSTGDFGDINMVYRRSLDNGDTWEPLEVLEGQGEGKFGNPVAVTDFETNTVWIFFMWNSAEIQSRSDIDEWGERKTYARYSADNGATWSPKTDLTSSVLPPDYTFDMIGPGTGIQTVKANPGRLIIPALHRNIYSDDHGATWNYQIIPSGSSESTIVERFDGTLMRNDRSVNDNITNRLVSTGTIASGFSNFVADDELLCPIAEASILRYTFSAKDRIFFLNSYSTTSRLLMHVQVSYDGGNSWPIRKKVFDWLTDQQCINQGKGGYSSMIKTEDNMVGALIENNEDPGNSETSHKSIEFHKFNLTWILNGASEP